MILNVCARMCIRVCSDKKLIINNIEIPIYLIKYDFKNKSSSSYFDRAKFMGSSSLFCYLKSTVSLSLSIPFSLFLSLSIPLSFSILLYLSLPFLNTINTFLHLKARSIAHKYNNFEQYKKGMFLFWNHCFWLIFNIPQSLLTKFVLLIFSQTRMYGRLKCQIWGTSWNIVNAGLYIYKDVLKVRDTRKSKQIILSKCQRRLYHWYQNNDGEVIVRWLTDYFICYIHNI